MTYVVKEATDQPGIFWLVNGKGGTICNFFEVVHGRPVALELAKIKAEMTCKLWNKTGFKMKLLKRLTMETKPFSLNKSTQNVGNRRSCTKGYNVWKNELGREIIQQLRAPFKVVTGKYKIIIEIGRKSSKADIDNLIKPIVDALVNLNVTPDDRHMEAVMISRIDGKTSYIEIYGEEPDHG